MPERIEPRILDDQAVEAAEYARKNGMQDIAVRFTSRALGEDRTSYPLTPAEITLISKDPKQRALLACLARIYVDAYKSLANQSCLPHEVLEHLEKAAVILESVYKHVGFMSSLIGVDKDHRGRRHDFSAEMPRDESKAALSASILYIGDKSDDLINKGKEILEETFNRLPNGYVTKPLIGVEMGLLDARLGRAWVPGVLENFLTLVENDLEENPDRVATVASWLIAWGEKTGIKEVADRGEEVFSGIIIRHPEWVSRPKREISKLKLQSKRDMVIKLSSLFLLQPARKNRLWEKLINL